MTAAGELAPLRVAVIDNLEINQFGTQRILSRVPGLIAEDDWLMDFDQALTRDDWSEVDIVLLDVAQEGSPLDETPSAPVARHIRATSRGIRPRIIAVTSNPIAYSEPLIHRRLVAADPNIGLIWREELEAQIKVAVDGLAILRSQEQMALSPRMDQKALDALGVHKGTDVEALFTGTRELMASKDRSERKTYRRRHRIQVRTNLEPKTKDGKEPIATEVPGLRQFDRIWSHFNPSILARLRNRDR